MDSEIINSIRNSYYLGKYVDCLSKWNEFKKGSDILADSQKKDIEFFVQKAMIMVLKKDAHLHTKSDVLQGLDLKGPFKKYLYPLEANVDESELEQIYVQFKEVFNEEKDNLDLQMINNYLCYTCGDFKGFVKVDSKYKACSLECRVLTIQAYIKCNQVREARKVLVEFSKHYEDDIAYSLSEISVLICEKQFDECISLIQELRQKFQDSLKLLNIAAACFIGNNEFSKALTTLEKIYNFFQKNPDQMNLRERDQCIRNMVVVHTILGKPQSTVEQYLQELNDGTNGEDPLIKKLSKCQEMLGVTEA